MATDWSNYFKTDGTIVKGGILGTVPAPQATTATAAPTSIPTGGSVPAPNYQGGANYYTADAATRQSIEQNEAKLNSDPSYVQSEIQRALQRKQELSNQGSATTDQDEYLNRLGYKAPAPPAPTVTTAPQPTVSPGIPTAANVPAPNTIDTNNLQQEAAARIAKQRAALNQAVTSTLTGLKNNYDYQNQITNDKRVLENNTFQRQNNPFSGKTDYLTADLARTRSIADTASNKDYQAAVSAANQKLADFDTMAPEQQQSIYDELLRIERDYGLNVGQLTGNFNGFRTLAGSAQDANFTGMYNNQQTMQAQNQAFQQQLALADLMGQMGGQSTLAGKQANLNAALQVGNQTGKVVSPSDNWGDLYNRASSSPQNYQAQQDTIKNGQWQQQFDTSNSQWQKTFEENVRQYGLDYALKQMQAQASMANANADNARQNAALGLQQQQYAWSRDPNNPDNMYKLAEINKTNSTIDSKYTQSLEKAVTLAQKDPSFQFATDDTTKQKIINYYVDLVNKSSGGSSDADIAQYLKAK